MRACISRPAERWPAPPAAASVAAAAATSNLNRLVAAGAPTISFLAGDTGRLPEIATNPTGAAIRTSFSSTFNTSLQGTLAGYANNGVIVHYLDLSQVLNNINANPAAYGITSGLVCPTFPNPTCVTNSSGYLFYGDALHLTSDGFKIVARYVAAQLDAPLTLQGPGDSAMNVSQQFGRTLTSRLDLGAPRDGGQPEGLHAYIVGDAYSRTANASLHNQHFASDTVGGTVGVDYGFGSGVIGIAGNYSKPKVKFGTGAADVRGHSVQVGAYAGFAVGGAFAQGYVGYGWDKHDITRSGVISDLSASPSGSHWIAGGKAGYLMGVGDVRLGPVVALDYARVKVDGYTEDGDAALTLNVSSAARRRCAAAPVPSCAATLAAAGCNSAVHRAGGGKGIGQPRSLDLLLADRCADDRQPLRLRRRVEQDLRSRDDRRDRADLQACRNRLGYLDDCRQEAGQRDLGPSRPPRRLLNKTRS